MDRSNPSAHRGRALLHAALAWVVGVAGSAPVQAACDAGQSTPFAGTGFIARFEGTVGAGPVALILERIDGERLKGRYADAPARSTPLAARLVGDRDIEMDLLDATDRVTATIRATFLRRDAAYPDARQDLGCEVLAGEWRAVAGTVRPVRLLLSGQHIGSIDRPFPENADTEGVMRRLIAFQSAVAAADYATIAQFGRYPVTAWVRDSKGKRRTLTLKDAQAFIAAAPQIFTRRTREWIAADFPRLAFSTEPYAMRVPFARGAVEFWQDGSIATLTGVSAP